MQLTSIYMKNWKCFTKKKIDFDKITFLNWKNGEGKTSVIQAIILCLFDKRPDGLDFASLVDISKESKIVLNFTHKANSYVVEREVGKTSAYKVFKNDELISRTNKESKQKLSEIISDSILTSLWGYEPLSVSNVLNTNYLYEILEEEFKEPLAIKQFFTTDKTYNQKRKSTLQAKIHNEKLTQKEIDALKEELDYIESKIKEKAFISDNEIVKAKQAAEDYKDYVKLKRELDNCLPYTYDRETCLKLREFGRTQEEWDSYFEDIEKQLEEEKAKTSGSPLIKYPKATITQLINESKCNDNKCILCGGEFHEPKIDYNIADNNKIQRLEKLLKEKEEEDWNFMRLLESMKYWSLTKKLNNVLYVEDYDYQSVLDNYDKDTNNKYKLYEEKKNTFATLNQDMANIQELLDATKKYDEDKNCISIVEQYIAEAKTYYANNIAETAKEILHNINARYTDLFIENGVYKVTLWDKDYMNQSVLAVQSLSKGEKTIVALSLILSIRDLFMKDLPLIMDESFANLDADNLDAIKTLIQNDTNQWIIVSHDERLVM